jgi:type IV secretion system protein VirB3
MEEQLNSENLYVGLTRPAMRFGVHVYGLYLEAIVGSTAAIWAGNPLWTVLIVIIVHLIQVVVCWRDPGLYHDGYLWLITKGTSLNNAYWGCVSFSPSSNVGNKKCKKIKL